MQHLPLPATGTAYPLGSGHHRGSPPSLHAGIDWPAKWRRSENAAAIFFSCFLTTLFFQRLRKMDSCTEHYAFWNFILDFFLIICISELKQIRCLLHGLCERRCFAYLLHCISILLKCEWKDYCALKCLTVSESTRWYSLLMVFPFVRVFASDICHQYLEGENRCNRYK